MKENKRFGKGQKIMNRKLAKKEAELRKKFTNHATKNNKSKQVFFTFRKTRIQIQFRPEQEEPMSQEHQPNPKGGFIKHSFIAVKVFTKLADGSKHFKGWFQNLPFSREARKTNSMLLRWRKKLVWVAAQDDNDMRYDVRKLVGIKFHHVDFTNEILSES